MTHYQEISFLLNSTRVFGLGEGTGEFRLKDKSKHVLYSFNTLEDDKVSG